MALGLYIQNKYDTDDFTTLDDRLTSILFCCLNTNLCDLLIMGIFDLYKKELKPVDESSIEKDEEMANLSNDVIENDKNSSIELSNEMMADKLLDTMEEVATIRTVCYSDEMLPESYVKDASAIYFGEWLVTDFAKVHKGDSVIKVKDTTISTTYLKDFRPNIEYIKTPYSGILVKKEKFWVTIQR